MKRKIILNISIILVILLVMSAKGTKSYEQGKIEEIQLADNSEYNQYSNMKETKSNISLKVGDIILYKNNNFKIRRMIGNAVIMVCIPNSNTPKIQIGEWMILQTCEDILNNACRNHFVDEELGIMSEDIYNARKTDYDNGWLETPSELNEEYWLSSGSIQDNNKPYIYLSYMQNGVGISSKLCHVWSGKSYVHSLAICPIIKINSNLVKCNSENQLYI